MDVEGLPRSVCETRCGPAPLGTDVSRVSPCFLANVILWTLARHCVQTALGGSVNVALRCCCASSSIVVCNPSLSNCIGAAATMLLYVLRFAACKSAFCYTGKKTPKSVGGGKFMFEIQATVAMEQQQIRLDIIVIAEAATCSGTRSNAISTHQDLIPEPHTRTPKRISQDPIKDPTRSSYKNFLWASQQNFHTSTSNAEHLQDFNARTSSGGFQQDLHKIFSPGPVQDPTRTY